MTYGKDKRFEGLDRDLIAKELADLGEPPARIEELEWAMAADSDFSGDVASVGALFFVADSQRENDGLSELDKRRVWTRLAGRFETRREPPRSRGAILTALAMAAGVILVTQLGPFESQSSALAEHEAVTQALGAQARASLEALGGDADGARARALADSYAMRLRGDGEGT